MSPDARESFGIRFAYRMFCSVLLTGLIFGCLRGAGVLSGSVPFQLFGLLGTLAVLAAVDCGRGRVPMLFVCAAAGAAAGYGLWRTSKILSAAGYQWMSGTASAAGSGLQGASGIAADFKEEQGILSAPELWGFFCAVLLAVSGYLLWILAERFLWLRLVTVLAEVASLGAAMAFGWQVPAPGVAAALLYLAAAAVEHVQRGWEKEKQGGNKAYVLWLVPFLLLYFVLVWLMPSKEEPYDWAFVKNIYRRAREEFLIITQNMFWGDGEDFGLSTSGFSEKADFSSGVQKSDREVMRLTGWPRSGSGVYLTGKIYDTFDGRQWSAESGDGQDRFFDVLETMYAVDRYDRDNMADYVRKTEIGVEYKYFHTKFLFAPLKTAEIEGFEEGRDYSADAAALLFGKRRHYGTAYQFAYYQMNLKHPDFAAFVEAFPMEESKEAWERQVRVQFGRSADIPIRALYEYRARMRERYGAAPALGAGAEEWLKKAVADAETDYEKLCRIEGALRGFSYNARPGELPEKVDSEEAFLEYFLTESKEGYCSYFATAFVLLARAEGIPARYVQGFGVPGQARSGWTTKETQVLAYMSHAWPEAYLEGVGWIPFEPTPGFGELRDIAWGTAGDRLREQEEAVASGSAAVQEEEPAPEAVPVTEEEEEEPEEENSPFRDWLFFAAWLCAGAAVFFTVFLGADALWEHGRARKRSVGESFRLEALRDFQILEALGYRRAADETLSELEGRMKSSTAAAGPALTALCEAVLYGGRTADEELLVELRRIRGGLLRELKEKKGRAYLLSRAALYIKRVRK